MIFHSIFGVFRHFHFSSELISQKKNKPNEENIKYEANLWSKIAKKFKNYPENLSFDLLIEPSKQLNKHPEILNKFIKVALEKIEEKNE